ncbi:MAG: hypothetical protein ACF8R9_05570 [Phycisphaerales bacterium JB054]
MRFSLRQICADAGRWVVGLSLSTRVFLGVLLGWLISPSLLGVLAEYATYSYALRNGVRLPAEGVPYVQVLVTTLGAAIMAGVAVSYFSVVAVAMAIRLFAQALVRDELHSSKGRKNSLTAFALILGGALAVTGTLNVVTGVPTIPMGRIGWAIMLVTVLLMLAILYLLHRVLIWVSASGVTLLIVCSAAIGLFSVNGYSWFLRQVRFGGELQVTVTTRTDSPSVTDAALLLRTRESLIVRPLAPGSPITEIPLSEVERIIYP